MTNACSRVFRVVGFSALVFQLSCTAAVEERCRFITAHVPAPEMPPGFAELDQFLIARATQMVLEARTLEGSLAVGFRKGFGEQLLPDLCHRLERGRTLAAAGRIEEAGATYEGLLLSSQVIHLAIAVHVMAQQADYAGQPGGHIDEVLKVFALQVGPLMEAALTEDPVRIESALATHGGAYGTWVDHLATWAGCVEAGSRRIKVAKQIWDIGMLVIAAHEAAVSAAAIARSGRPPMPPLPALVPAGGGAAAMGLSAGAYRELAEALRKLIASGAVDAAVVAGLSGMLGKGGAPAIPGTLQMNAGDDGLTKPVDPEAFSKWLETGKKTPTPAKSPQSLYEIRVAGPWNYEVRGAGAKAVVADGARPADGYLLEAKFVGQPTTSPYIDGSQCPPAVRAEVSRKLENELSRYAAVIRDPATPARGLEVITNDARAVPFFKRMLEKLGIRGRVVVRP